MNKRGDVSQVEDVVGFLWKILIMIVVFVVVFLLIRSHAKLEVDTFEAEADLFAFRMLYAKGALSYYDAEIDRVYPGVIEIEGFGSEEYMDSLENAIYYLDNSHIAAEISIVTEDGVDFGPIYFNEDYYRRWLPIARTFGTGPGAVRMKEKSFYVLLKDRRNVDKERLAYLQPTDREYDELMQKVGGEKHYGDTKTVPARMDMRILIPNS